MRNVISNQMQRMLTRQKRGVDAIGSNDKGFERHSAMAAASTLAGTRDVGSFAQ